MYFFFTSSIVPFLILCINNTVCTSLIYYYFTAQCFAFNTQLFRVCSIMSGYVSLGVLGVRIAKL